MDEVVIKCDDKCVITVTSVEDIPKFVTVIRPSDNAKSDTAKLDDEQSLDDPSSH